MNLQTVSSLKTVLTKVALETVVFLTGCFQVSIGICFFRCSFLFQELLFPLEVSPQCGWACLLPFLQHHSSGGCPPGVQGEREAGGQGEVEGEDMALVSAWQNLRHWVSSGGRASPIFSGKGDICQPMTLTAASGGVPVIFSEE